MAKVVEFHEAQITLAVKTIEDGRVTDVQRFQLAVLVDTPQEWAQAVALIQAQLVALRSDDDGDLGITEAK